jgi:hypothetical protein
LTQNWSSRILSEWWSAISPHEEVAWCSQSLCKAPHSVGHMAFCLLVKDLLWGCQLEYTAASKRLALYHYSVWAQMFTVLQLIVCPTSGRSASILMVITMYRVQV